MEDAEVHAALAHGFRITIEAFILRKEKADDLAGMRFAFPAVGAVEDFFLFRAFKTCIF